MSIAIVPTFIRKKINSFLPETFQHPLSPEIAARKTKSKNRQRQATQVLQEENHQNVL
jgi:hypothetical protein